MDYASAEASDPDSIDKYFISCVAALVRNTHIQEDTTAPSIRYWTPGMELSEDVLWLVSSTISALRHEIERPSNVVDYGLILPLPSRMFFSSDCAPPLPASPRPSQTWQGWYHATCRAMLDNPATFDGHWCGYYTYDDRAITGHAVGNIVFTRSVDGQKVRLNAEGCKDASKTFELAAEVKLFGPNDGIVASFTRTDAGGIVTQWDCLLTPFGIYGHWRRARPQYTSRPVWSQGIVWLWKQDWCEDIAPKVGD